MRLRPALAALAVLALASPLLPTASAAVEEGTGSDSLVAVANLPYKAATGSTANRGTDIEFAEIAGKEYALSGTYKNGLQFIDISEPESPKVAGVYSCGVQQGDVQVFTREVGDVERTFAGFTMDTGYTATASTKCFTEAKALGFNVGTNGFGTFIADITDIANPKTVSFVPFAKGSHNHTIHPSGNFLYNSNSDLITSAPNTAIEIFDISNFAAPKQLPNLVLPPIPTSLGSESHDITFSDDGKRAYSAALSQTAIINTEDPAEPVLISTIVDPTINVVHQSDPVTLKDRTTGLTREFLVIEDELAGATGTGQCPNGGVHVYDITDQLEQAPVKVGYWNIDEVRTTSNTTLGTCTAHVFDLHEEAGIMTIAYYNGGVRVVDINGLVGVALGTAGVGMKELGFRRFTNSNTWAAKTPKVNVDKDGAIKPFYLYGNDQARGLDVYKFDASKALSTSTGVWMGAAEASKALASRANLDLTGYRMLCLPAQAPAASPVQDALQAAHHG